ncbi:preprotein translocase subunit SecE [Guptibacillus spartinae]|uniref:preprotein translocase subunit SecE n=1 Tax=Guptibacillus spartinae TaxID=3025679 RepID=UPI0023630FE2|nr:preprotein translocase subunit SecE [Pseudalkalibacillus spartinae]
MIRKPILFLNNVRAELKKVRWTTKQELVSYALTVGLTVLVMTLFFAFSDYVISNSIRYMLKWF